MSDNQAFDYLIDLLRLTINLGRPDAHTTGIEYRIRATINDEAPVIGLGNIVPMTPQPREFVEISRVVLVPTGIIPESDGHGGKRLTASEFPFFPRSQHLPLIVTHLDFHPQPLSLNLASPNRLSGVATNKAGHNVRAPGNRRKANIRLNRIVNIIKTLRHQWRSSGKYGLQCRKVMGVSRSDTGFRGRINKLG